VIFPKIYLEIGIVIPCLPSLTLPWQPLSGMPFFRILNFHLTFIRPGVGGILQARTLDVYNIFYKQAKATKLGGFS